MQNFLALGDPPPDPRASGGSPSLRRLGASPPDPHWPPEVYESNIQKYTNPKPNLSSNDPFGPFFLRK